MQSSTLLLAVLAGGALAEVKESWGKHWDEMTETEKDANVADWLWASQSGRPPRQLKVDGKVMKAATTTRYWDCSYQHCTGHIQDTFMGRWNCPTPRFHDEQNPNCQGDAPVKCADAKLGIFEHKGELYGTAAASSSLGVSSGDSLACGKCYELHVNAGEQKGKKLTVMVTNWCPECAEGKAPLGNSSGYYHFDIAVPGGGQGLAPSCTRQFPEVDAKLWETVPKWEKPEGLESKPKWNCPLPCDTKEQQVAYGAKMWREFNHKKRKVYYEYQLERNKKAYEGCSNLPASHQKSCQLWYKTFGDTNLPVYFKETRCPAVLHSRNCL